MKEIKLTFKKDGTVKKEVSGYTNNSCLAETDFIDSAIGEVKETELKADFYAPEAEGLSAESQVFI